MVFNSYQTQLTEELYQSINPKIKEELNETIQSIPFIQNLISKDRKKAKDLKRWNSPNIKDRVEDPKGKIDVDITNPHILENMDYFREAAICYEKHKIYTLLRPNKNPNSDYKKFWKEQARRCREGYVRVSDGEWVTGDYYWYLNFSPIMVTKIEQGKKAARVSGHPLVYDGDYLFFHYMEKCRDAGSHAGVLKARGKGYSFKACSGLSKIFVLGDLVDSTEEQIAFVFANEKEYLIKDGTLNKFVKQIDHCASKTPFPRARLKDSINDMHWKMGYKDPVTGVEKGVLNEIMGVSLKDDPDKARGKRGAKIYWEEVGKLPKFLTSWQIARPSVEEDGYAFGLMVAYGTGGTEEADFKGLEEIFYRPLGYNVFGIPNVFDKNVDERNLCAFFMPTYLNMKECFDHDGNSDVVKALIRILDERQMVKDNVSDPNSLIQIKAERPITPQEAILRKEGSIFPVTEIRDYLSEIIPDLDRFLSPHYKGRLTMNSQGQVNWKMDSDVRIIRDFPLDSKEDKEGAVEIFSLPKSVNGEIPWGRYIAGCDPYDDDHSTTNSLGSLFVMDSWTDKIVAEYTGRPRTADEFYRNVLLTLKFFNAQCNYENDKKGMFGYFKTHNALQYLCDTPKILRDLDLIKEMGYGNKSKGTPSGKMTNRWGRRLQADWLLESVQVVDEKGEEITTIKLHTVRSIPYLKELLQWNPDGNFDRISAMGMLMILRTDNLQMIELAKSEKKQETGGDEFWLRPFSQNKRGRYSVLSKSVQDIKNLNAVKL